MHNFDRIPPNQFALLAALLGVLLNLSLDVDEQNSFGNFLVSIGQTMLTSAAQSVNQDAHPDQNILAQKIDQMSKELDELKKQIKC